VLVILAIGVAALAVGLGLRRAQRLERARATLVSQREEERRRLRRELHDGVGPTLAALRLELDGLGNERETNRARALLDEAIAEVRRVSRDLRPAALDELGLLGALRQQACALGGAAGPQIEVDLPADLPRLDAAVEVAALRIGSEAMANSVRHSDATQCRVTVTVADGLRLTVEDDGVGVDGTTAGVGLRSMRARAEELGGWCEIGTGEVGGTRVSAMLPLRSGSDP
jgi:signal transduction histidine kinase